MDQNKCERFQDGDHPIHDRDKLISSKRITKKIWSNEFPRYKDKNEVDNYTGTVEPRLIELRGVKQFRNYFFSVKP